MEENYENRVDKPPTAGGCLAIFLVLILPLSAVAWLAFKYLPVFDYLPLMSHE